MAAKKKPGTQIVNWDAELAAEAEVAAKDEQKAGGSFLSTRAGQLSFQGNPIAGNRLNVVILDYMYENARYASDFDSDNPQSPVCYAFARKAEELAPHAESEEPQHEQCEGCPLNEWGSAEKGRGKGCKNSRRLALITADSLDEIDDAQVALLSLPVTSCKGWAAYVQQLAMTIKRPPYGVITEVSLVPDPDTQYKVAFKLIGNVDGSLMGQVKAKRETVESMLLAPYPKNSTRAPIPKSPKTTRRKKF